MPRRILHVINNLKMGGAESLLYYMLTHLQNQPDYHFEVAVLFEEGPFAVALKEQGISVTRLGFRPRWNPWTMFVLITYLGASDYDLVHVHLFPAGLIVAMASVLFPCTPLVYTVHNVWNRRRGSRFWKTIDGFIYSRYHKILAVSSRVAGALTEWAPAAGPKVTILPNAVEVSRFEQEISDDDIERLRDELAIAPASKVLFFAGRLARAKGLDILLDALSALLEEDCVLLIAGVGPLQDELVVEARRKSIEQRVRFLGFRQDIPRLLRFADVFVLPSRWEGVPVAILEAMAAQKPIVASAVGGSQEIIRHGEEGLLVPAEDATALSIAIKALLKDTDLANQLAFNAKQRVIEHYSVPVVSNQLLQIYEDVLSQPCRA